MANSARTDGDEPSAAQRLSAIPELLEHIFTFLLCQILPLTDQEDPRSIRVYGNTNVLKHLLRCSEVGRDWNQCMSESKRLQRALFLLPEYTTNRSWDHRATASTARLRSSYYTAPSLRAPRLNPVIQTTFGAYHFRFWHLSLESTGNKHCAYLIITRRDIPAVALRAQTGQGRSISRMLLSQPPCTHLRATIWEERDETRDYVGRTSALKDPVIMCDDGVTIGMVHERVSKMFDEHRDVAAIKLTTI